MVVRGQWRLLHLLSVSARDKRITRAMEGAVERGEREVMDQFLFMQLVLPVLLVTLLTPFVGVSVGLVLQILVLSYNVWVLKECWESERPRIQLEERKKIDAKKVMTEGETLRWMNEGVKAMWPISMEKFASKHFFIPMAPWFLNRFKPPYVKEVTLQSLHLGSTPPHFSLIRALPSPQDGDDVVFEANMEFSSAKDMNAEMTVRVNPMKINFFISNLYIKGRVKFSVKFVKGWPVIGRVRFSFADTPSVDMTARPRYGPEVKFIPGAANWLLATLSTALEQSVVEPYMLAIDFEKLVSNMLFSDVMPRRGFQDFFTVEPKSGFSQLVLVEILETGDLKPPKGTGVPDYVVDVSLGKHKLTVKSKAEALNTVWDNEVQRIPIENWLLPNMLTLQVISKRSKSSSRGRRIGICSIGVNDYRGGERHEMKLKIEDDRHISSGWVRFAVTVEDSQYVEEPAGSVRSQPTTQDLQSISPPPSATASTISALLHTRSTSTEGVAALHEEHDEGGSSEIIKMPNGADGAFSIEYPGEEEALYFSDHPTTSARKPRNEKVPFESRDRDAKVKRYITSILRRKKRSTSKVSQKISPAEREMPLSEHSGYCSSLERSTEFKIHRGAMNLKLLSPEMPSQDPAPHVDVRPLELEPVVSENGEARKTPDLGHGHNNISLTEPQPHHEVQGPSYSGDLIIRSPRGQEPEKQNSKNSRWKIWTKLPKRRTRRGSSKPNPVSEQHDQPEDASYDPSDTSASQSFRKERQDILKELLRHQDDNVTTTDNGHSILNCGRSLSCRQDSSRKKVIYRGGLSQSMRMEPSSSLLKTIHEKRRP